MHLTVAICDDVTRIHAPVRKQAAESRVLTSEEQLAERAEAIVRLNRRIRSLELQLEQTRTEVGIRTPS
jgi:phage shock protein A